MKRKIWIYFPVALLLLIFFTNFSEAQNKNEGTSSIVSAFRKYMDVKNLPMIKTPRVVEVPIMDLPSLERFDFAVFDNNTKAFEPYYFKQEIIAYETPVSVVYTNPIVPNAKNLTDKNVNTFTDFLLPENARGKAEILLETSRPVVLSSITILLANNVALPSSVEVRTVINGESRIVVAPKKIYEQTISFPQTTSKHWTIILTYNQPLRISEIRMNEDNIAKYNFGSIRFLAQPGHTYRIYFDADRYVPPSTKEVGNLHSAQNVLSLGNISPNINPQYLAADIDKDGIQDILDNCVNIYNPDQIDENENGRGDACDDFDEDGIINPQDNCPNSPNFNQQDTDQDGIGDVCDNEESRFTERYPFIPWIGMGLAALILLVLFIITIRSSLYKNPNKGL
jgi:hypothetical protein